MSETACDNVGREWTASSYAAHNESMLALDRMYQAELRQADLRCQDERDRRYAEVNVEKEKALKIKETADLANYWR